MKESQTSERTKLVEAFAALIEHASEDDLNRLVVALDTLKIVEPKIYTAQLGNRLLNDIFTMIDDEFDNRPTEVAA